MSTTNDWLKDWWPIFVNGVIPKEFDHRITQLVNEALLHQIAELHVTLQTRPDITRDEIMELLGGKIAELQSKREQP